MPARAKRPCRHKGCAAITNDVSGYCDQHRQQHAGDGWRNYQSGKSRQERGYGRLWEIKRARNHNRGTMEITGTLGYFRSDNSSFYTASGTFTLGGSTAAKSFTGSNFTYGVPVNFNASRTWSGVTNTTGNHAHSVAIGAHAHSIAIGSHGHSVTVNATGNAENTVKNIAFNYIVRLA